MKLRDSSRVKVDINIASLMLPVMHGRHAKDMVVLHETVSPDYTGFVDILSNARYLPANGLGIHGIVDAEGYLAWSVAMDTGILYHCDSRGPSGQSHGVNTRSIGIEQVSRVMLDYKAQDQRFRAWWKRNKEIDKVAQVLAYLHRTHNIPLTYSDGTKPGITTHWSVSKAYNVPGGHVDCWPHHLGGYYPVMHVIERARTFYKRGY